MTAKEVMKKLLEAGWYELPGKKTGHKHFKHPERPGKTTIAMHKGDIPPKTLSNIEKQSGVKLK